MERNSIAPPAQVHTPSQSFSDTPATATATEGGAALKEDGEAEFKKEHLWASQRLVDQTFMIDAYPDPLLPRPPPRMPQDMTPETEQRLLAVLAKAKASTQ